MASNCAGFAFTIRRPQLSAGLRLMLWLFLFAVKIAETVRFQVDEVLDRSRSAAPDRSTSSSRSRCCASDSNTRTSLVRRRSFGRNPAHLADHAAELRRLHELSVDAPAAVDMLSLINVPPKSLAPASSAICDSLGPSFTHETCRLGI